MLPTPKYYGWVIVLIALVCSALSSPGQSFLLALYLEDLLVELDLSRVQLSAIYSAATLGAAAMLPLAGWIADRVTSRTYLCGVILLLALACLNMATVRGAAHVAVALFLLRLLAQGAIGLGTLTATVRWFRQYRARALAFVGLGYAAGEMIFPAITLGLIAMLGWRESWVVFAAAYGLVFAPAIFRLVRERDPERESWDGLAQAHGSLRTTAAIPLHEPPTVVLGAAIRLPVFWAIIFCVAIPPLVVTGLILHQISLFESQAWTASWVAPAFMSYAVGGMLSMYLTGFILERVQPRVAIAGALLLLATAISALWFLTPSILSAITYGSLLGAASGTMSTANLVVWPNFFGIGAVGRIKGVVNATRNGATALGPVAIAVLAAHDGTYGAAFAALIALAAGGALLSLCCKAPDSSDYPIVDEATASAA